MYIYLIKIPQNFSTAISKNLSMEIQLRQDLLDIINLIKNQLNEIDEYITYKYIFIDMN